MTARTHPTAPPQPPQSRAAPSAAQARLDAYAAGYRAARTVPSAPLPDLADALLAEWLSGWRVGSAGA